MCMYVAPPVLRKYEDEFFKVVDAKVNLHLLRHKLVVSESVVHQITAADTIDAKEILYDHLNNYATVDTLSLGLYST